MNLTLTNRDVTNISISYMSLLLLFSYVLSYEQINIYLKNYLK